MKLYRSGNLPEFIFAVTFPVALGVYSAAEELGLKIPDDIDIMCFGDSDVKQISFSIIELRKSADRTDWKESS